MSSMKRLLALTLTLTLSAVAFVSCGGDDRTATDEAPVTATIEGNPTIIYIETDPDGDFAYIEENLIADAGVTRIEFENPQSTAHDADLEDEGGKVVGDAATVSEGGDAATMDPPLKPGEYTFFCSVPGHREDGMEGTLTIK